MKYFQQVPTSYADQIVFGPEMADGIDKDGAALGIKQTTAAAMRAKTDLLDQTNKAYNLSRTLQEGAYVNFHASDDALTAWMVKVTAALSTFFGRRWNRQWVQVGFINPSIGIPKALQDRVSLALNMVSFLTTNPDKEAPNQGVTAANGKTLRDAVSRRRNSRPIPTPT